MAGLPPLAVDAARAEAQRRAVQQDRYDAATRDIVSRESELFPNTSFSPEEARVRADFGNRQRYARVPENVRANLGPFVGADEDRVGENIAAVDTEADLRERNPGLMGGQRKLAGLFGARVSPQAGDALPGELTSERLMARMYATPTRVFLSPTAAVAKLAGVDVPDEYVTAGHDVQEFNAANPPQTPVESAAGSLFETLGTVASYGSPTSIPGGAARVGMRLTPRAIPKIAGALPAFVAAEELPGVVSGRTTVGDVAGRAVTAPASLAVDVARSPERVVDSARSMISEGPTVENIESLNQAIQPLAILGGIKLLERARTTKRPAKPDPVTGERDALLGQLASLRQKISESRTDVELKRLTAERDAIMNRLKQGPTESEVPDEGRQAENEQLDRRPQATESPEAVRAVDPKPDQEGRVAEEVQVDAARRAGEAPISVRGTPSPPPAGAFRIPSAEQIVDTGNPARRYQAVVDETPIEVDPVLKSPTPESVSLAVRSLFGRTVGSLDQAEVRFLGEVYNGDIAKRLQGTPAGDSLRQLANARRTAEFAFNSGGADADLIDANVRPRVEAALRGIETPPAPVAEVRPPEPGINTPPSNERTLQQPTAEVKETPENFTTPKPSEAIPQDVPSLYRETSAGRALEVLPGTYVASPFGSPEFYFATSPELAIGQGTNRGVLIEFAGDFKTRPNNTKPAADFVRATGGGEERIGVIDESALKKRVRSVTIKPDARGQRYEILRLRRLMNSLTKHDGWTEESLPDGSRKYTRPVATPEVPNPVEPLPTPEPKSIANEPESAPAGLLGAESGGGGTGQGPPESPPAPGEPSPPGRGPSEQPSKIARDIADNTVEVLKDKVRRKVEFGRAVGQVASMAVRRGLAFIERSSQTGSRVAKEAREVDFEAARRAANDRADFQRVLNRIPNIREGSLPNRVIDALRGTPTYSVHERIAQALDGKYRVEDLPREAREAVDELREILDRSLVDFQELGGQRRVRGEKLNVAGSGRAFPQIPNAAGERFLAAAQSEGLRNGRVFQWATEQVARGKYENVESAISALKDYHDGFLRQTNQYLESDRVELPLELRDWDPQSVLPRVLDQNAMTIESMRKWGIEREIDGVARRNNVDRLNSDIERIRAETGDPGLARAIDEFFRVELGRRDVAPRFSEKATGAVSNFLSATLLSSILGPIRNVLQVFPNSARFPLSVQVRAAFEQFPIARKFAEASRRLTTDLERSGAVGARGTLTSLERAPLRGVADLATRPFRASEIDSQLITARTAQLGVQRELAELAKLQKAGPIVRFVNGLMNLDVNRIETIKRNLRRSGVNDLTDEQLLDVMDRGEMTPNEMQEAIYRITMDNIFAQRMSNRFLWWGNSPWLRLTAKFKPFGAEMTKLLYRDVVREARYGNLGPLKRFAIGSFLATEIYAMGKDLLKGGQASIVSKLLNDDKRIASDLLSNLGGGGAFGLLADLTWGISDYLGGPAAGLLDNIRTAVGHSIRNPRQTPDALLDFLKRQSPGFDQVFGAVRRTRELFGDQASQDYYAERAIRAQARNFKDGTATPYEQMTDPLMDALFGPHKFTPGDSTLQLELASRKLTLGDIDGAAESMRLILDGAASDEEFDSMAKSLQSAVYRRSPLGTLNQQQRIDFIDSLPKERADEILDYEFQWQERYIEAFDRALIDAEKNRRSKNGITGHTRKDGSDQRGQQAA